MIDPYWHSPVPVGNSDGMGAAGLSEEWDRLTRTYPDRWASTMGDERYQWFRETMVKYGVTIFFQAHDHIFVRQELDGVVYQSVPNPADDTYTARNRDAYLSGDALDNSGYLNVTVSSERLEVDYIRSWLPQDETDGRRHGEVAYSYTVER